VLGVSCAEIANEMVGFHLAQTEGGDLCRHARILHR
jgi:hypothetical protein